ncbi:hypothetical protein [Sediminibacterium sp.]|uniref:hypothetical protein n=1 Tax=Sediminibacterium sp. TaxID=1917865 RepID=UPI0025FF274A|nr:hypothetical protein [Sediminibacterium sp.]MBW0177579.1 hypothetical protein [Sediminibacterium sp.]
MNLRLSVVLIVLLLFEQSATLCAQTSYDALGGYFRLRNSGSTLTYGGFSQKGAFEGNASLDPALWAETNYGLYFYTNGAAAAPKMSIMPGGNIGIGLSNPSATFHIHTPSSSVLRFSRASSNDFGFEYGGATFGLYDYSNNKYRWQVDGSNLLLTPLDGLVGIGTSNPTTLLDITKASSNGVAVTIRNTQSTASALSGLRMGNDLAANRFEAFTLSSAYEQYGPYYPDGTSLANEGTGGLSIGALHANGDLRMYAGGNSNAHERLRIQANGNIVSYSKMLIGSSNPDIGGSVNGIRLDNNGTIYSAVSGTGAYDFPLYVDRRGTNNTGTSVMLAMGGFYKSTIGVIGTNNSINDGGLTFSTVNHTSTITVTEQMRIMSSGNVGIGTTTPTEKLSVNGNVRAKKIIVSQSGWPDYVFDPAYKLKPLSELSAFIQQYKHLPDMPSAKEVDEKGISVGDNQALLLKKIEELTLYIMQQETRIKELEKKIK